MSDLKHIFDGALKNEPPAGELDLDTLEQAGRRHVRRRRMGIAGAVTTGVAAVTAAALIIPGAPFGADGSPTQNAHPAAEQGEDTPQEQPEFPFPELDPDRKYVFHPSADGESTAETEKLTAIFWDFMAANVPELGVYAPANAGTLTFLEPEEYPEIERTESELWLTPEDTEYPQRFTPATDLFESTGYQRPVYGFSSYSEHQSVWFTGSDRESFDTLGVTVHPKGSFDTEPRSYSDGSEWKTVAPHLATGCEDMITSTQTATNNHGQLYDCSTTTGPAGEHVQVVEMTSTGGETYPDTIHQKRLTVIVTLANGNAVVVTDTLDRRIVGADYGLVDITDTEPYFNADQLIELATFLPQVTVY